MHLKRWITGLIALPILILLIFQKSMVVFSIFVGIVSILTLWEYFKIVLNKRDTQIVGPIPIIGFLTSALIIFAAFLNNIPLILALISTNVLLTGMMSLSFFKQDTSITELVALEVLGTIYISFFLGCLVMIRGSESGAYWILFVLIIIFAGDTGALYAGTFFGKHKLCPSISPGKTIEGSLGGLSANILIGSIYKILFLPSLNWGLCILFFILIGAIGQMGDLFESQFKRYSGIKDSGGILPGHGGFLDRIDALLFAAPIAYVFKFYIF